MAVNSTSPEQGFSYSNYQLASSDGGTLHGHLWLPADLDTQNKLPAVAIVFHGFGAHGNYPTVRYVAEILAEGGMAVLSADMRGHGKSPGDAGFVASKEQLVTDALDLNAHASARFSGVRKVLVGSSMGGALALLVALNHPEDYAGCVLMAPMVKIAESAKPPPCQLCCLQCLACVPGIRSIGLLSPKGLAPEKQYRDLHRLKECTEDPLSFGGKICLATGASLLSVCGELEGRLHEVSVPLLVIHGTADELVPIEGSRRLCREAATEDKTLEEYEGMLHAPLCELPDVREKVAKQVVEWVKSRCQVSNKSKM